MMNQSSKPAPTNPSNQSGPKPANQATPVTGNAEKKTGPDADKQAEKKPEDEKSEPVKTADSKS